MSEPFDQEASSTVETKPTRTGSSGERLSSMLAVAFSSMVIGAFAIGVISYAQTPNEATDDDKENLSATTSVTETYTITNQVRSTDADGNLECVAEVWEVPVEEWNRESRLGATNAQIVGSGPGSFRSPVFPFNYPVRTEACTGTPEPPRTVIHIVGEDCDLEGWELPFNVTPDTDEPAVDGGSWRMSENDPEVKRAIAAFRYANPDAKPIDNLESIIQCDAWITTKSGLVRAESELLSR